MVGWDASTDQVAAGTKGKSAAVVQTHHANRPNFLGADLTCVLSDELEYKSPTVLLRIGDFMRRAGYSCVKQVLFTLTSKTLKKTP
jgi:hypothetical protein